MGGLVEALKFPLEVGGHGGVADDKQVFVVGGVGGMAPVVGTHHHHLAIQNRKFVVQFVALGQGGNTDAGDGGGPGFVFAVQFAAVVGQGEAHHVQSFAVAAVGKAGVNQGADGHAPLGDCPKLVTNGLLGKHEQRQVDLLGGLAQGFGDQAVDAFGPRLGGRGGGKLHFHHRAGPRGKASWTGGLLQAKLAVGLATGAIAPHQGKFRPKGLGQARAVNHQQGVGVAPAFLRP